MGELSSAAWDTFLVQFPDAHLLQTAAWGDLKSAYGWEARRVVSGRCGAQILFRRLPLGFHIAYIPKGPVGPLEDWGAILPEIDRLCRKQRTIFLKIEPDRWDGPETLLLDGFRPGSQSIQPRRTILIDLDGDEATWLARMKPKTRYNIRLAEKKEVLVRPSADIDAFHQLMVETSKRDRFGVHSRDYYQRAYDLFHPREECELLLAEYCGQVLAGLMVFRRGARAWYLYGASNDVERNRMPAYLLQWEAMRWARAKGSSQYDLWGVPDENLDVLEAQFEARSDGLWGVYRFKRGFGGEMKRAAGAADRVYMPVLYALYGRMKAG